MYFPASQIIPNLSAISGEFIYKNTNQPFSGDYFATVSGKYYTGKQPFPGSLEIIPFQEVYVPNPKPKLQISSKYVPSYMITDEEYADSGSFVAPTPPSFVTGGNIGDLKNQTYMVLKDIPKSRFIPQYYQNTPTDKEFSLGQYTRYYARHNTKNIYLEISEDDHLSLSGRDSNYAFEMYSSTGLSWSISINSPNYEQNKHTIEQTEKKLGWVGFSQYFKGKFDNTSVSQNYFYTKGKQFILPNRTNYIGYYHIMPQPLKLSQGVSQQFSQNKPQYMTGRYHGDGPEIILIPIISQPQIQASQQTTSNSPTGGGGGGGY